MAITLDGTNGITSPDFEPSSSTTPTNGLFLPAANTVGLATGSTERLRIDSSGNVGIGVTPSAWGSSAKAIQIGTGGFIEGRTSASAIELGSNAYINSSNAWTYQSAGAASYYAQWTGAHYWYTAPSGTAGAAISFTQAMTLDASGNLAIGGTSASARLHVYDAIASTSVMAGTYVQNLSFTTNTQAGVGFLAADNYNAKIYTLRTGSSAGNIVFATNGGGGVGEANVAERARIDSSGNLLVGTTVTGGNTSGFLAAMYSGGTYTRVAHSTGASSGDGYVQFYYNGNQIGSVSQSGTAAVAYNTSSDQRLKENIVDAPSALGSVNAIKVRSFDWKSDGSHVDYGYIAQELLEIVPEAVSIPADPEEMMGVDFGKLTPRLVKAIQELTARLEALEAK